MTLVFGSPLDLLAVVVTVLIVKSIAGDVLATALRHGAKAFF